MFNQLGKVDGQCTETVRFDLVEKEDSNKLELYLSTDDSEPGSAPIDMIVELSRYCGFKENGENAVLLSHILSPRHTSEIEKYLKSKGVSFEGREHGNTHGKSLCRKRNHVDHLTLLRCSSRKRHATASGPLSKY